MVTQQTSSSSSTSSGSGRDGGGNSAQVDRVAGCTALSGAPVWLFAQAGTFSCNFHAAAASAAGW